MALEAVVFPHDPVFLGYYRSSDFMFPFGSPFSDVGDSDPLFGGAATTSLRSGSCYSSTAGETAAAAEGGGGRRKRRRRSRKNEEEVEKQRRTHIAVERNRRKQMNDYLAAIRSLMPPSYAQRGDQASIVGGAINYVKELEQHLQSLEAQKTTTASSKRLQIQHHPETAGDHQSEPPPAVSGAYSSPPRQWSGGDGAVEVEVKVTDSHASVKIQTVRRPKQLLKLVAGFQALRLSVLHVNVTAVHHQSALYTFSLKVEESSDQNSTEEIAAAANSILEKIQQEAAI